MKKSKHLKNTIIRFVAFMLAVIFMIAGTVNVLAADADIPASAISASEEMESLAETQEESSSTEIIEETAAADGVSEIPYQEISSEDSENVVLDSKDSEEQSENVEEETPETAETEETAAAETETVQEETPQESEAVTEPEMSEHTFLFEGEDYSCSVTMNGTAENLSGYSLDVSEIPFNTAEYEEYVSRTSEALSQGAIHRARFFDISILDAEGRVVQPADGELVSVNIVINDFEHEDANVVHFGEETEVLDIQTDGEAISFETSGFSVYAIVTLDKADEEYEWTKITTMEEFEENMNGGLYIAHVDGYYLTASSAKITNSRNGIRKTEPPSDNPMDAAGAAKYFFEKDGDKYYAYCYNANREKKYVQLAGTSLNLVADASTATAFTIDKFPGYNDVFRIHATYNNSEYCWNMRGGTSGHEFASYNNMTDVNARLKFEYTDEDDDQFSLNGRELRIIYVKEDIKSIAMTNGSFVSGGKSRITAETMLTRRDIINGEGVMIVASETDVPKYKFENINENKYLVSTIEGGTKKYLSLSSEGAKLVSTPDGESTNITVTEGTGANKGKYLLQSDSGYTLMQSGEYAGNGFMASSTISQTCYLNFAEELTELSPDDFVSYTAKKVSVSDTANVHDQSKVIVYTRVWNTETLKYDYYLVDYNGKLVKATESGDEIRWVNGKVNTLLWNFTEYQNSDGSPNYYYELTNEYSEVNIAPQLEGDQTISLNPIGINMTGRRYGENYTTLLAWDDIYYDYAGLKIENGELVVCPMAQAIPFYFAVLSEDYTQEGLTVVPTIDNDEYGISMKMIDFNGALTNSRNKQQTDLLGWDTNGKGLVLPYLNDQGYPATDPAVTGQPAGTLEDLFGDATYANHLFSEMTYNENGYFEYDSTQNSAYIGDGTDFTVYNQLVTMPGGSQSLNHGQFMPYNSIINPDTGEPWPFSTTHFNTNSTTNEELPDSNPRKGESLYEIPKKDTSNSYPGTNVAQPYKYADYFFGMQMEASFTQTPNGLDKWNHDIIFEFSGDDDMWLFVDGRLILDIGGVHSASTGTVNFRTGEVNLIVKNAQNKVLPERTETTDLRTLFEASYRAEHPSATNAEVDEFLNEYFKPGTSVFKDYSKHDMKMFYMERGASASNLKLKFNLTSVQPGHLLLEKNVTGTTSQDYNFAEFPFQIYYLNHETPDYVLLTPDTANAEIVYKDSIIPVPFSASYTPAGGDTTYRNVFFLKSGQIADITLPPDTLSYYVVECGINSNIYDNVSINGELVQPTQAGNRSDFVSGQNTVGDVPQIVYDNHVNPNALRTLTITKRLFAEDGVTELSHEDDDTTFNFRVYFCDENQSVFSPANMLPYHVKDESGNYCRWNPQAQDFTSIGKNNYADLTESEKISATFVTSPNGSISKIPAGFSVEMQEIPVGTKFRIIERDNEIPAGYVLMENGYVRVQGTYIVEDGDLPNEGKIRDNSDPVVEVHNKRIWELTVNKVWSDEDYVDSHDDIFIAVYNDNDDTIISDTVRVIPSGEHSLTYRFDTLLPGTGFEDYIVREVELTGNYVIDADGYVTGYDTITPVTNTTTVNATVEEGGQPEPFIYNVTYALGEMEGVNDNIRTDTVTNTRAGLMIVKTDMEGVPLSNATFTLTDQNEHHIGAASYTSDEEGFVTIAYLSDETYTLTETAVPVGYRSLANSFEITKSGNDYTITSDNLDAFTYDDTGIMPVLTVMNKPFSLTAVKIDGDTGEPLEGVRFSLYRQVMGTEGPRRDYRPIANYSNLITDSNGLIPADFSVLPAGTYYLTEIRALPGYALPEHDVCFTIHADGTVSLEAGSGGSLDINDDLTETINVITIENASPANNLSITKMVAGNNGDRNKQFSFTIHFSSNQVILPSYFEYEGTNGSGTVQLNNGDVSFTLAHGETITIIGVPLGISYVVEEADYSTAGYVMSSSESLSGTVTAGRPIDITVTNTRNAAIPTDINDRNITLAAGIMLICTALAGLVYGRKKKKKYFLK